MFLEPQPTGANHGLGATSGSFARSSASMRCFSSSVITASMPAAIAAGYGNPSFASRANFVMETTWMHTACQPVVEVLGDTLAFMTRRERVRCEPQRQAGIFQPPLGSVPPTPRWLMVR